MFGTVCGNNVAPATLQLFYQYTPQTFGPEKCDICYSRALFQNVKFQKAAMRQNKYRFSVNHRCQCCLRWNNFLKRFHQHPSSSIPHLRGHPEAEQGTRERRRQRQG